MATQRWLRLSETSSNREGEGDGEALSLAHRVLKDGENRSWAGKEERVMHRRPRRGTSEEVKAENSLNTRGWSVDMFMSAEHAVLC